jgi:hypothetical protein
LLTLGNNCDFRGEARVRTFEPELKGARRIARSRQKIAKNHDQVLP